VDLLTRLVEDPKMLGAKELVKGNAHHQIVQRVSQRQIDRVDEGLRVGILGQVWLQAAQPRVQKDRPARLQRPAIHQRRYIGNLAVVIVALPQLMVDQVDQIAGDLANVGQVVERGLGPQHVLLDRRADIVPGLAVSAQQAARPGVQVPPQPRAVQHEEIKAGLYRHLAVAGEQRFDVLRVPDENMMPFDAGNAKAKDVAVTVEEAAE